MSDEQHKPLMAIPVVSPQDAPVTYATGRHEVAISQAGRMLKIAKKMDLPTDRCIKCNAESDGRPLKRRVAWQSGYWYLLLCAGVLLFLIVALVVRKEAVVHVGLCHKHRSIRRNAILATWLLVLAMIPLIWVSAEINVPWLAIAGILSFILGLVVYLAAGQVVTAARIDDQYVWLNGVGRSYRERFPRG